MSTANKEEKGKKVLIVEDAGADRRVFRRLLEKKDDITDLIFAWDAKKKRVSIDIKKKEVINEGMYLFSWDSVPGSDNEKLIKFLKDDFDIDWAEDSEIHKSEDRTIGISKDENSAEIIIDEKNENVTLKIRDGRTRDLKVKNENGKLNIYKELIEKKISKYDIIFIDLAWTKDEEDKCGELRTLKFSEMVNRKDEFIKSIKGLALLDSLRDNKKIEKIVTTSFYLSDIAKFCFQLKADEVFHKWADEDEINQFLEEKVQ